MKSALILLTGVLLFYSQRLTAQATDKNASLLWKISGHGLAKPSYLFGTIHVICLDDYLWTDKMKASLDTCEKVCFEMDLDDHQTMVSASEGLMDTSGKLLKTYFTNAQYQRLQRFVRDTIGMDISLFQQMKPIALQSVIEMKSTNCLIPVSYEETIMRTAQETHKEILGLEDPSEQINVLETLPTDSVIKEVLDDVENFQKSKKEYSDLVSAYKQQQLPKLYSMITSSASLGDNMGAFLDDRNKKWISRMAVKMSGNAVFFAVGAGHLPGDNGVINLLRKAGYSVEPLK